LSVEKKKTFHKGETTKEGWGRGISVAPLSDIIATLPENEAPSHFSFYSLVGKTEGFIGTPEERQRILGSTCYYRGGGGDEEKVKNGNKQ